MRPGNPTLWFHAAAVALLAFMAVLAGGAALRESAGIDEIAHIGAGVTYLQKLDLRFNEEHPPLSKVMAGAPLAARGVKADYSSQSWTISDSFFPAYGLQWVFGNLLLTQWNEYASTLAWARLPMLLLTLALGWLIYVYASRLGGPWAGLLCLSVYVTTPAFLAFGPLVLNDVPIAFFSLWTIWEVGNLWQEPTRKRAVVLGVALAGAMLSKFSAGILLLCIAGVALSMRLRPVAGQPWAKPDLSIWRRLRRRQLWFAILVCAAVVYGAYFLLSWNQPTSALDRLGQSAATEPLRRVLLPGWLYLRGLLMMAVMSSRPTFILGHAYRHGVWFYFPVLFALKSALGFLALIALTVFVAFRTRGHVKPVSEEVRIHWRAISVSFAVFTGVLLVSRLNISIRHFSVPLTLGILLLAPLPRMLRGRWSRALAVGLAASCFVTAALAWPNYIPYVNALGFGRPAYQLMNDSNVDWNQSLPEVKKFAAAHNIQAIKVDFYGITDAAAVVRGAVVWDCQAPANEDAGKWAVLSANVILDSHNCAWVMRYPHVSLGGGSMYAVRLPDVIPAAGTPGGPPPVAQRRIIFGMPIDIRAFVGDLSRHPENIAKTMAEMEEQFKAQQDKARK